MVLIPSLVLTCASDGYIAVWDLRKQKLTAGKLDILGGNKNKEPELKSLNSNAFDHLDLTWKPLVKIHITIPQQTTFLTPVTLSLIETFNNDKKLQVISANNPNRLPEKVASNRNLEKLEELSTDFYAGTDDGKIVKSQIKFVRDSESGKMGSAKAKWMRGAHDGKLGSVICNPYFRNVVLCIGGYSFSVWNLSDKNIENGQADYPLVTSPLAKTKYTCGQWSSTRPSTFYWFGFFEKMVPD